MSLRPTRCFTCGKVLSTAFTLYDDLTQDDGFSDTDAVSQLQTPRSCCVRTILTSKEIDQFEGEQLSYEPINRFPQPAARPKGGAETLHKLPSIPHLGGYEPTGKLLDFVTANLVLSNDAQLKQDEADDLPNPVEWSERSRILGLILLLASTVSGDSRRVLYLGCGGISAGAMRYVMQLFDQHTFTLFDHHDIDPELLKLGRSADYNSRLRVEKRNFTKSDASELSGEVDVFFCEYMLANPAKAQYEQQIDTDMRNQLDWYIKIAPANAFLRLRIPKIRSAFDYLGGRLLLMPWTSPLNAEVYLSVDDPTDIKYTSYDYTTHRQRMLYHNRVSRLSAWRHMAVKDSFGIDECWDCAAECSILEQYIKATNPDIIRPRLLSTIREMTVQISEALDETGTVTLMAPPQEEADEDEKEDIEAAASAL